MEHGGEGGESAVHSGVGGGGDRPARLEAMRGEKCLMHFCQAADFQAAQVSKKISTVQNVQSGNFMRVVMFVKKKRLYIPLVMSNQ